MILLEKPKKEGNFTIPLDTVRDGIVMAMMVYSWSHSRTRREYEVVYVLCDRDGTFHGVRQRRSKNDDVVLSRVCIKFACSRTALEWIAADVARVLANPKHRPAPFVHPEQK